MTNMEQMLVQLAGYGPRAWHIVTVKPGKDATALTWFERAGIEATSVTETKWVRSKRSPHRAPVPRQSRCYPGYLFAKVAASARWDLLLGGAPFDECLRGVVCVDGRPRPLTAQEYDMALSAPLMSRAREARARAGARLKAERGLIVGASVPVLGGTAQVSAIEGDMARLVLPMLGRTEVVCDVSRLAKPQRV